MIRIVVLVSDSKWEMITTLLEGYTNFVLASISYNPVSIRYNPDSSSLVSLSQSG